MLNTLKQMMIDAYCTRKEEIVQDLTTENKSLEEQILELRNENLKLEQRVCVLDKSLKSALDEIVLNQTRITALLKQLSEKNGGK